MSGERAPIMHRLKFAGADLCDAVYEGRKPFEIRFNDRDYRSGDFIQPVSIDENGDRINHPIDNVKYVITFICYEWHVALKDGYCVFGIKQVDS